MYFHGLFDEFTVTFDSDGGSAVSEQKVLNSSAIEPNEPKRNGYDFAGWYLMMQSIPLIPRLLGILL